MGAGAFIAKGLQQNNPADKEWHKNRPQKEAEPLSLRAGFHCLHLVLYVNLHCILQQPLPKSFLHLGNSIFLWLSQNADDIHLDVPQNFVFSSHGTVGWGSWTLSQRGALLRVRDKKSQKIRMF